MSDPDRPITEAELRPLLEALGQFFEGSGPALQALLHQGQANSVVCALLLREMAKAELIDAEALKQEALAIAEKFEPRESSAGVAQVITSIFGGELADMPPQVILRVIQGGLDHASRDRGAGEPQDADDETP